MRNQLCKAHTLTSERAHTQGKAAVLWKQSPFCKLTCSSVAEQDWALWWDLKAVCKLLAS